MINIKHVIMIIVIMVLFNIFSKILFAPSYATGGKIHKYSEIKQKLKSGDIILFSCKKFDSSINKFEYNLRTKFIGSEYGHAGIIYKKDKRLYLLECTYYDHIGYEKAKYLNDKKKGGVRIIDLDYLINEYYKDSRALFAVKYISKEIPDKVMDDTIKKYKDVIFPNRYLFYLIFLIYYCLSETLASEIGIRLIDENHRMCTEFMHHFLNNCKVLKEYPSKLFWPWKITDGTMDKLQIIKYSDAYKFLP